MVRESTNPSGVELSSGVSRFAGENELSTTLLNAIVVERRRRCNEMRYERVNRRRERWVKFCIEEKYYTMRKLEVSYFGFC